MEDSTVTGQKQVDTETCPSVSLDMLRKSWQSKTCQTWSLSIYNVIKNLSSLDRSQLFSWLRVSPCRESIVALKRLRVSVSVWDSSFFLSRPPKFVTSKISIFHFSLFCCYPSLFTDKTPLNTSYKKI